MTDTEVKRLIQSAVKSFSSGDLTEKALCFFQTLGYNTERQSPLSPKIFDSFRNSFLEENQKFKEDKAQVKKWKSVDLLFQLTAEELSGQKTLFSTGKVKWEGEDKETVMETYLFFALELAASDYTRTALAQITREINKVFPMPVMVLFKHGGFLTLSVINRRLNKKDDRKDVLEKVTLIKDIAIASPHRAHIEILFDLSFKELQRVHKIAGFVDLHNAWRKTLDTKELNKRFYRELSNWYFWALREVNFPGGTDATDRGSLFKEEERLKEHNAKNLIRLLTRLLFVWFVKEKNLIPDALFDEAYIRDHLIDGFEPRKKSGFSQKTQESKYYRAILQNLFFATLNQTVGKREFRKSGQHMNVTTLMRYETYFKNPKAFIRLVEETVPFMNGGLFECLDSPAPFAKGKKGGDVILYEDGFSDRKENPLCVPDYIFFGTGEHADLSEELGNKKQKDVTVSGLIQILKNYKFTVTENTPIEEDVALDPELLGRVFENLLASYNPETKTTARKQTGSFYTPREIVNYMVDESLKAYLAGKLASEAGMTPADAEAGLELLLGYNEKDHLFDEGQTTVLIKAIDACKILDPACGSGAFPMGILHKLVHILHKIDPQNKRWKERQMEKVDSLIEDAGHINDSAIRDKIIADLESSKKDIEDSFANNELDYGRKLFLIETCIYGVDIQPIATQISKLRFFISLIVDQKTDKTKDNFGIRPLPNLETKFVAANTLIDIEKPDKQMGLFEDPAIKDLEKKLKDVRHRIFSARTPATKRKLREEDQALREEMGSRLEKCGYANETARLLAAWDPYNQNATSPFFDPEWMFGIADGFDVVIGNPPYISALDFSKIYGKNLREKLNSNFQSATGTYDYFVLFIEQGVNFCNKNGLLCFITPNKYLSAKYAEGLRGWVLGNATVLKILDVSKISVFEEASVYPIVSIFRKDTFPVKYVNAILPEAPKSDVFQIEDYKTFLIPYELLKILPENIWGFILSKNVLLLNSVLKNTKPLSKLGAVNATSTASEADEYGKHLSNVKSDDSKKVINTGTIEPFVSLWGDAGMTHAGQKFLTPFLPLKKAKVNQRRIEMYNSPKVLFAKMAKSCEAVVDLHAEFASLNTNCFYNPKDNISIEYIGAISNSKLFMFVYDLFFGALRMSGGYYQFQAPQLRVIPIANCDSSQSEFFNKIVKIAIYSLIKHTNNLKIDFNKLINSMVYEIYFPDEIKAADAGVLKHLTSLPEFKDDWPDEKKLEVIEKIYKVLSDPKHPAAVAMEKQKTVPEVRIIEGLDNGK